MANWRSALTPFRPAAQRAKQLKKSTTFPISLHTSHYQQENNMHKMGEKHSCVRCEKELIHATFKSLFIPTFSGKKRVAFSTIFLSCRAACACDRCAVVRYSAHTLERALWILISHFVICRYPGGALCALECEASVCLDVTAAAAADLHFSVGEEDSGMCMWSGAFSGFWL